MQVNLSNAADGSGFTAPQAKGKVQRVMFILTEETNAESLSGEEAFGLAFCRGVNRIPSEYMALMGTNTFSVNTLRDIA